MVMGIAIFSERRFASLFEPPVLGTGVCCGAGYGVYVRCGEVWRWPIGLPCRTDTALPNNQMHQTGTLAFAPRSIV